jgi:hypothetical protein
VNIRRRNRQAIVDAAGTFRQANIPEISREVKSPAAGRHYRVRVVHDSLPVFHEQAARRLRERRAFWHECRIVALVQGDLHQSITGASANFRPFWRHRRTAFPTSRRTTIITARKVLFRVRDASPFPVLADHDRIVTLDVASCNTSSIAFRPNLAHVAAALARFASR